MKKVIKENSILSQRVVVHFTLKVDLKADVFFKIGCLMYFRKLLAHGFVGG